MAVKLTNDDLIRYGAGSEVEATKQTHVRITAGLDLELKGQAIRAQPEKLVVMRVWCHHRVGISWKCVKPIDMCYLRMQN